MDLAKKDGYMYQLELEFTDVPDLWVFVRPEYLSSVARGGSRCVVRNGKSVPQGSMSHKDHPYFDDTRNHLEREGYIHGERSYSNGDRVLRPFYFNNILLEEGDQFSCAGAMMYMFGKEENYNGGKPKGGLLNYKTIEA